jgi:hypothetical protein
MRGGAGASSISGAQSSRSSGKRSASEMYELGAELLKNDQLGNAQCACCEDEEPGRDEPAERLPDGEGQPIDIGELGLELVDEVVDEAGDEDSDEV